MPIFRVEGKVVLFAHVPKCGGGSIEKALAENGFELSFYDGAFWKRDESCWYRSSPQHIDHHHLRMLFPNGFFDYEFAVVRDPVSRFLSAFNHHRRRIGKFTSFDSFLSRLERRVRAHDDYFSYRFDNHFVPAARFISPDAQVFHLEDGLDLALRKISEDLQINLTAPSGKHNVKTYDFTDSPNRIRKAVKRIFLSDSPTKEDLSDVQLERIRALYREDYQRFGNSLK